MGRRISDSGFVYNLGGNSQSQTVVTLADGSNAIIWVFDPALTAIAGIEITIVNNADGSTPLTASQVFALGEIGIFQGYQPPRGMQIKWMPGLDNLLAVPVSVNRQPHKVAHRYNRTLDLRFGIDRGANVFGNPPSDMSFDRFSYIAANRETLLAIPIWRDLTAALDTSMIHSTALFGYATKIGKPQHIENGLYDMAMSFAEFPPAAFQ